MHTLHLMLPSVGGNKDIWINLSVDEKWNFLLFCVIIGPVSVRNSNLFSPFVFFLGYAGRTELPDNLKSMFRPISMVVPDSTQIAEILLFAEGFNNCKVLPLKKIILEVCWKEECRESLKSASDKGLSCYKWTDGWIMFLLIKLKNLNNIYKQVMFKTKSI